MNEINNLKDKVARHYGFPKGSGGGIDSIIADVEWAANELTRLTERLDESYVITLEEELEQVRADALKLRDDLGRIHRESGGVHNHSGGTARLLLDTEYLEQWRKPLQKLTEGLKKLI